MGEYREMDELPVVSVWGDKKEWVKLLLVPARGVKERWFVFLSNRRGGIQRAGWSSGFQNLG